VQSGPPPPRLPRFEVRPQSEATSAVDFSALLCGISLTLSRPCVFLTQDGKQDHPPFFPLFPSLGTLRRQCGFQGGAGGRFSS
jgi:hypothetical protein